MPDKKHVHKFRRHTYSSGNIVFFCALPDCNVKIKPALTFGKRSLCWRCGEEFLMDEYTIRLAKPHCQNCHKPKILDSIQLDTETIPAVVITQPAITSLRERMNTLSKTQDEEDI